MVVGAVRKNAGRQTWPPFGEDWRQSWPHKGCVFAEGHQPKTRLSIVVLRRSSAVLVRHFFEGVLCDIPARINALAIGVARIIVARRRPGRLGACKAWGRTRLCWCRPLTILLLLPMLLEASTINHTPGWEVGSWTLVAPTLVIPSNTSTRITPQSESTTDDRALRPPSSKNAFSLTHCQNCRCVFNLPSSAHIGASCQRHRRAGGSSDREMFFFWREFRG